jgi:flagellar hook-basal body complex protein FliE
MKNLTIENTRALLQNPSVQNTRNTVSVQVERPGQTPSVGRVNGNISFSESQKTFEGFLKTKIDEVNQLQKDADTAAQALASGKETNIHEVMIKLEKAEMATKMLTRVRNKFLKAYKEVMNMQV